MKVLVVAPSWIGDMVLAQPMMKLLHACHSPLELDVLAPRWTLPPAPLGSHPPSWEQAG